MQTAITDDTPLSSLLVKLRLWNCASNALNKSSALMTLGDLKRFISEYPANSYPSFGKVSYEEGLRVIAAPELRKETAPKTEAEARMSEAYKLRQAGAPYKEIGEHFGVSLTRARQLYFAAARRFDLPRA